MVTPGPALSHRVPIHKSVTPLYTAAVSTRPRQPASTASKPDTALAIFKGYPGTLSTYPMIKQEIQQLQRRLKADQAKLKDLENGTSTKASLGAALGGALGISTVAAAGVMGLLVPPLGAALLSIVSPAAALGATVGSGALLTGAAVSLHRLDQKRDQIELEIYNLRDDLGEFLDNSISYNSGPHILEKLKKSSDLNEGSQAILDLYDQLVSRIEDDKYDDQKEALAKLTAEEAIRARKLSPPAALYKYGKRLLRDFPKNTRAEELACVRLAQGAFSTLSRLKVFHPEAETLKRRSLEITQRLDELTTTLMTTKHLRHSWPSLIRYVLTGWYDENHPEITISSLLPDSPTPDYAPGHITREEDKVKIGRVYVPIRKPNPEAKPPKAGA